ncbi:XRE family transcriptional regulator [Nocardioides sp.]|uniref:helix-turn-helix domain-containing protein n=1 Tax=Nocardioides sp. TaxID=35761 RepID=UPI00321A3BCD
MNTRTRAQEVAPLFDGTRLALARHLAGMRKSELANKIDRSPSAVTAWEAGGKQPTAANIAELAIGLKVDPWFFAVRGEDVSTVNVAPHFRSLRSTSQILRDQALAYGQIAVDVASAIEVHAEFPTPQVPEFQVEPGDIVGPDYAARHVREAWDLAPGPAGHQVRLLETHGVLVVFSPPGAAAIDAYSFAAADRPAVVLNPIKKDYYRQRFDVAHELGHLVMHGEAEPGSKAIEDQAHRFASEFLMPANEIHDQLPTAMGRSAWTTLFRLKEHWGVSVSALLFRARQLGRLSDVSYRNAMIRMSQSGWRRDEPGAIASIEQPSLMPRALELLDSIGITADELIAQCRIPSHLFEAVTGRTPWIDASGSAAVSDADRNVAEPPDGHAKRKSSIVSLLRPPSSTTGDLAHPEE